LIAKRSGIYQSFIFLVLNLVRDVNYDKIPSCSLAKWEECKKLDISYFELKEVEKSLGKMSVEGQAQLMTEFVNEYGENLEELRAKTLSDTKILDTMVQGPMRKWFK